MSTEFDQELTAVRLTTGTEWFVYIIPVPAFPLKASQRKELFASVALLIRLLREESNANRSAWLELDHLHQDNAIQQIGKCAPLWNPEIGLGLKPEAESPRYWTEDDLTNRDHDSPMPALMRNILLLNTSDEHSAQACQSMTGTGGLTQVIHRCTTERMRRAWYEVLHPFITEEGLAAFPIYMPLLTTESLTASALPMVEHCMREVDVYIRESAEEKGVFLISARALEPWLEAAGLLQSPVE